MPFCKLSIVFLLASTMFFGGCSREFKPGDIAGSYRGTNLGINSHGEFQNINWAKFEASANGTFKGTIGWSSDGTGPGHASDGGHVTHGDTEEVLGLFNPKDGTFVFVESKEMGTAVGALKPDGTLEILKTQPGESPMASFATLKREDAK